MRTLAAMPAGVAEGPHRPNVGATELEERVAAAQQQLNEVLTELAHQQRLGTLGTLAAALAHEFNNILTPVLSYTQLALADPTDAALSQKALARAHAGAERASRLASSMLGFSQPGRTTSHPSCGFPRGSDSSDLASTAGMHPENARSTCNSARVSDVVQSALACLGRDLERDGIRLSVDIPSSLRVQMDDLSLQQILVNVLLNARAALLGTRTSPSASSTPSRSPRIDRRILIAAGWLSTKDDPLTRASDSSHWPTTRSDAHAPVDRAEQPTPCTWISVRDNGPGIPQEQLARLFMPFTNQRSCHQTSSASQAIPSPRGHGLGLFVSARLLANAQGALNVRSLIGSGTIMTIVLPAETSPENIDSDDSATPIGSTSPVHPLS
jgi:signal transduction histidine kinase